GHAVAERRTEQNAMVDLDLECVDGERDVVVRAEREARAQIDGLFRAQRLGVEQASRAIRHRNNQNVRHYATDDVGVDVTEMGLAKTWRPEAGVSGRAEGELP